METRNNESTEDNPTERNAGNAQGTNDPCEKPLDMDKETQGEHGGAEMSGDFFVGWFDI